MHKVCHVQLLPILSGVQRAMLEMFRHLDRRRYELHVACQGPGPLVDELRRLGVACHFVPALRREIRPLADVRALGALTALFRRERFDLVHTHSSKPGVLGRLAAHRAGVPCIVHHVHGFAYHAPSAWLKGRVFDAIERWVGRRSDHVLFVNHEDRQRAIRDGILRASQCRTIYNGIDLGPLRHPAAGERRAEFRRGHGLGDDEVAILFLGRYDYLKQPLLLPPLADRLRQLGPRRRWRLVLAGAGDQEPALRRAFAQRGLDAELLWIGWQTDPTPALLGCDVQVQPSRSEGLPLSLIEGHAAGMPAVGSNVRGIREVVAHGQTGWLCEASDAEAFAARLCELIDDEPRRAWFGAAARRRAETLFDGDRNLRQLAACYAEWLSDPRPARRAA